MNALQFIVQVAFWVCVGVCKLIIAITEWFFLFIYKWRFAILILLVCILCGFMLFSIVCDYYPP